MGEEQQEELQEEVLEVEQEAGVHVEPEEQPAEQPEDEEVEEVIVSIGDEEPPAEDETKAPDWVREVRKQNRELQKKLREKEAELASRSAPEVKSLGKKPSLEDFDYDADRFEEALTGWYDKKRQVDEQAAQAEAAAQAQQRAWQEKLNSYEQAKVSLKVKDYDDAEAMAQETFNVTQQGIILQGAENPALWIYGTAKSKTHRDRLSQIKDPVKFAWESGKLEGMMKVQTDRKAPPPPETTPKGSGPKSGAVDSTLERLREKASKTGDRTEVIRYLAEQRKKSSR